MSVNKVILVGRLGQDPDVRYMPNETAVCNFSLATSSSYKDKTGEKVDQTEWHRIVMFGKVAEIAKEYLKKGSQIFVEGRLQTRKWQTKDGQDRYTTEVVAATMQMLGSKDNAQVEVTHQVILSNKKVSHLMSLRRLHLLQLNPLINWKTIFHFKNI